jgi:putative transposase
MRLSETRGMAAAKTFFCSAGTVTAIVPARVTMDGHDSHPRAIGTQLGQVVKHRANRYLDHRVKQSHCGIKGCYGSMRGFENHDAAARFCRGYDELCNFLQPQSRRSRQVPANSRCHRFLRRGITVLHIIEAV